MRAEPLPAGREGDSAVLSVRLSGDDGSEHVCSVAVPQAWAADHREDDTTAPLGLALMLAAWRGEDLDVRGSVDSLALARAPRLIEHVTTMFTGRRAPRLTVAGEHTAPGGDGRVIAGTLSRGVDSVYLAARGETLAGPIEHLVFADGFEPAHGIDTRAAEITAARGIAERLGLGFTAVRADIRGPIDGTADLDDVIDAALAWIGHACAGGVRHLALGSGMYLRLIAPGGSHPLLAPLLSSSALEIEAGSTVHSRAGKIAWLRDHRPDLIAEIKVCFASDDAGNCGKCPKCLVTMTCLRACGVAHLAPQFPRMEAGRLEGLKLSLMRWRVEWNDIMRHAQATGDDELAAAIRRLLQFSARVHPVPAAAAWRTGLTEQSADLYTTAVGGIADPGLDGRIVKDGPPSQILGTPVPRGLLRTLDLRGRRHLYGAGTRPPGELTAELGALTTPGEGRVALWLTPEGGVATEDWRPEPCSGGRLRWALAPLRRGDTRAVLRRALDTALARPSAAPEGPPAGHLEREGGPDRLPLYAAAHPIMGDVLLATDAEEFATAGYPEPVLLGHLLADAPETGRLGIHRRPVIPWAR